MKKVEERGLPLLVIKYFPVRIIYRFFEFRWKLFDLLMVFERQVMVQEKFETLCLSALDEWLVVLQ